jgi:hypothetical protein
MFKKNLELILILNCFFIIVVVHGLTPFFIHFSFAVPHTEHQSFLFIVCTVAALASIPGQIQINFA